MRIQFKCVIGEMLSFSGRCHIRQYCPNKANTIEKNLFVLASIKGFVCDMLFYQRDTILTHLFGQFGLGESAVLHLPESLVPDQIFLKNYSTFVKRCDELQHPDLHSTGKVMKNWTKVISQTLKWAVTIYFGITPVIIQSQYKMKLKDGHSKEINMNVQQT